MSSQLSGIEFGLADPLREANGLRLAIVAKGDVHKPGDPKTVSNSTGCTPLANAQW